MHCASFRFDHAKEPGTPPLAFIGKKSVTDSDHIIALCSSRQTFTQPVHRLNAVSVDNLPADPQQRIIVLCKTGLTAWRTALRMQTLCPNPIALMAESAL